MDIDNTSLCFVTAHLAAGFANYEERNRDFRTINQGLHFQRGRTIEAHDTVIWLGDFNYRIGLSYERAVKLAKSNDFETLYENDQLNLQMVAGLTFPHYAEARIFFPPTYKYDLETDEYDTSEKARIPAWCDRILRKGNNLRQINYDAAPLRFSDHRPVYATFLCKVSIVNERLKASMSGELYDKRKTVVAGATANPKNDDSDDEEDLLGYDSIEPGLPPASSDRRRWWLDNGMPARSTLQPPGKGMLPNPERPSNPWTPSSQPDWITGPGASKTATNAQAAPPLPSREASVRKAVPTSSPSVGPAMNSRAPVRNASISSMQSVSSNGTSLGVRKAPPTIPRKPPSLASANGSNTPTSRASIDEQKGSQAPSGQVGQTPIWRVPASGTGPLPKAGTATNVSQQSLPSTFRNGVVNPGPPSNASMTRTTVGRTVANGTPPRLPVRPQAGLIDDDDDVDNGSMSAWAPLKPT
jgi:hypothetical protein